MNTLFLMNPLETVHPLKDTTLMFMVEAHRRGHRVHYLPANGISLDRGRLVFDAEIVVPTPDRDRLFERIGPVRLSADEADLVFIRTDPPFDAQYLAHTWLLDYAPRRLLVVNDPNGVRSANEKIWALQFTEFVPASLVTQNITEAMDFLADQGEIVAKPIDGFGGKGVFVLRKGDSNARVAFETLTDDGGKPIIAQAFVPEAKVGDKRILLLDGEPLGAVLRVHSEADHRNNFFAGGLPHAVDITSRDRRIIAALKPHLQRLGLYFVGIDILGDYLIEVNVTSPTCLQEMNRLYNVRLERPVLDFVEQTLERTRKSAILNEAS